MNTMKNNKNIFAILILSFVIIPALNVLTAQTTLIPKGGVWKYLDNGTDPGTSWTGVSFDDNAWKTGTAHFGYGDGDETTIVYYGPDDNNKYPTTYFRNKFTVTNPGRFIYWEMKLVRDDGAVVYLNGHEIHRVNMPAGEIDYLTFANADGTDATFFLIDLPASSFQYLLEGENVIAVEIHQGSGNSSDLSFDFEFIVSETPPPPKPIVRKEPYLTYGGKNSEMNLSWQLRETKVCQVSIGTDNTYSLGSYETTEYGNDHQHMYTFTNLIPGTKYYYKVTADNQTIENTFFAAPNDNEQNLKFLSYGDSRSFPDAHNLLAAAINSTFAEGYQTLAVCVGDYCDNGGEEESWDNEYFSPDLKNVRKLMGSVALQGTIGDHEDDGDGGKLYRKYFNYEYQNPFGKNFAFNYGPALFISIDQFSSMAKSGAQYKWIENLLATTTKKWKFAFMHFPGWSTGAHDNNTTVQNVLQPLFEKYKVSIVFTGHNHIYARGTVDGVKHVTTGGGGAPLYDPRPDNENPNIEAYKKDYHYCKINIEGDKLTFQAVLMDGTVFDEFTMDAITPVEDPDKEAAVPDEFELFDAYPNPFNPTTRISFALPEKTNAKLEIFDSLGKLVTTAINAELENGVYHYNWNASGLASGVYLYKLTTEQFTNTKKLSLLK